MKKVLPVLVVLGVGDGADCLGIWAGQSAAQPASAGRAAAETSKISIYQIAFCGVALMR